LRQETGTSPSAGGDDDEAAAAADTAILTKTISPLVEDEEEEATVGWWSKMSTCHPREMLSSPIAPEVKSWTTHVLLSQP
jgi:hypothetical protein